MSRKQEEEAAFRRYFPGKKKFYKAPLRENEALLFLLFLIKEKQEKKNCRVTPNCFPLLPLPLLL